MARARAFAATRRAAARAYVGASSAPTARRRRQAGRSRGGQGRRGLRRRRTGARARASYLARPRRRRRRSSSRSGCAGPEASVIAICDGRDAVALPAVARPQAAAATATRARTPAAWAPTRRCRTSPTRPSTTIVETVHRPILAELAARGTPFVGFLYAGLMLTDDGPRAPRVQRPARRSRGAGDPAAARGRRSGRCSLPPPRATSLARGTAPAAPDASRARPSASCSRRRATRATPKRGDADRGARRRRGRRAPSCSTAARSAGPAAATATNGGRVLTVVGRGPDLRRGARGRPRRPRTAISWTACSAATTSPPTLPPAPAVASGPPRDPALHAPRDGRDLVRARRGSSTCSGSSSRSRRAQAGRGRVPPDALAAIEARATVDVARIEELERTTDHDVIAFVSPGRRVDRAGGPLPAPRPDVVSDVVDTALALQLRAAGELLLRDADRLARGRSSPAPGPRPTRVMMGRTHSVHAEPTTFGLKLAGWAFEVDRGRRRLADGRRRDRDRQALRARSGRTATSSPDIEAEVLGRARAARRPGEHPDRPARPPRGAADRDRDPRRQPRAVRDRDPQPPAHRDRRGPGAVQGRARRARRRCPTSATRSCRSASRVSPACSAATPRPRSRTSRCGTSATSATRSAERVILPDATILLDYLLQKVDGPRSGPRRPAASGCARTSSAASGSTPRRASCWRWSSVPGSRGRRPTRSSSGRRSRAADERRPLRELLAIDADRRRAAEPRRPRRLLRRRRATSRHVPEVIARLDTLVPQERAGPRARPPDVTADARG